MPAPDSSTQTTGLSTSVPSCLSRHHFRFQWICSFTRPIRSMNVSFPSACPPVPHSLKVGRKKSMVLPAYLSHHSRREEDMFSKDEYNFYCTLLAFYLFLASAFSRRSHCHFAMLKTNFFLSARSLRQFFLQSFTASLQIFPVFGRLLNQCRYRILSPPTHYYLSSAPINVSALFPLSQVVRLLTSSACSLHTISP